MLRVWVMKFRSPRQTSLQSCQWGAMCTLCRTVALNSSPITLSWLATLLSSSSCTASPLGARCCGEAQDGCSFWGSRSGRGPCRLEACSCSSLSESDCSPEKSLGATVPRLLSSLQLQSCEKGGGVDDGDNAGNCW